MTTQSERATTFTSLHVKGNPVILFNIWDAGSAQAVQVAGAKALATGSASVAEAQGYTDGENLPFEFALANLKRIVRVVDLPVSLDMEGGYGRSAEALQKNIAQVIEAGAIGINFEDQIVEGAGLYSIEEQVRRIQAIRQAAEQTGVPLFINARTDIFLQAAPATHNEAHLTEAIERAKAYAEAGASGFFAPGLRQASFIGRLCAESPLPVNIILLKDVPPAKPLAELGVARISHGPYPYRHMIAWLTNAARDGLNGV
jgi:2-methylisocitrate lyase-like PEP mutase family enzyme